MSCCGGNSNWGIGGCCGGNIQHHCDSSAFESSCTDEGQGFPLSIKVGCQLPTGYTPMPHIVAFWNGVSWIVGTDSSTASSSTDSSVVPEPDNLVVTDPHDGGIEVPNGSTIVRTVSALDSFHFDGIWSALSSGPLMFGPMVVDDSSGIINLLNSPSGLWPFGMNPGDSGQIIQSTINPMLPGTYSGSFTISAIGAANSPFVINFELTVT